MRWKLHIPLIRLVSALLLFQFFAPAFLNTSNHRSQTEITVHSSNEGILFPVLLKEKDETESREDRPPVFSLPVLIDLSYVSQALTLTHKLKFQSGSDDVRFNYFPPLHKLHCTFLI